MPKKKKPTPKRATKGKMTAKGLKALKAGAGKTSKARAQKATKIAKSVRNAKGSAMRAADDLRKIKNRKY